MSPGIGSRMAGALVALCAVLTSLVGVGALPAAAHNNGGATPLIQQFRLTPLASGWNVDIQIVDSDLGTPVRGAKVIAVAGAKQTPQLAQGSTPGSYVGTLTGIQPGPQTLAVRVSSQPGNDPVNPFRQSWNVTLAAGEPLAVVATGGGGGGSHLGLILGVTGAVIVLAVLYTVFLARRRTPVPAAGKAKARA